ncbi:MAG TPA: VOC family protein [Streptosporangiaceae bacterium]|nr:VOC family protein [Streptosporangiaceae bacterium]
MATKISHMYIWVEDQDRALAFYTKKLGFEIRDDVRMGGRRWLTVGPPGQPDLRLALTAMSALEPGAAAAVRDMQAKGTVNGGGMTTHDCHATYRDLLAKGVSFVQEPADRPYGIEAIFEDDSGNLWGVVEFRAPLAHHPAPHPGGRCVS